MKTEIIDVDTPPQRRGGRPKKASADLRNKRLNVRFTESEYAEICEKAAAANLTPTDYAHAQLIGSDMPASIPKLNIDMYRWLQPLATNINEIVKKANGGEQVNIDPRELKEFSLRLIDLRKALIGVKK